MGDPLQPNDVIEISNLVSRYGHVIDAREWDSLPELFTDDAVFDSSSMADGAVVTGLAAIRSRWEVWPRHPIAHHATNVVVSAAEPDTATVVSKGLGIRDEGVTTVVYRDTVVRTEHGWRIKRRSAHLLGQS
jgi:ketosteroid isomerase-like protein